jgi:hypothetical protein
MAARGLAPSGERPDRVKFTKFTVSRENPRHPLVDEAPGRERAAEWRIADLFIFCSMRQEEHEKGAVGKCFLTRRRGRGRRAVISVPGTCQAL